ncbi:MAG TPA: C-GCAxxG-C-C family (seleno)protein [Anaeromyxobacteraceae bacterium]|nr:C-GCAxxG-C-C family (seleno)protein [Anaeromyxobacteraceae bacterium]
MPVKAAMHAYGNERLNCAQSVLKGFREQVEISQQDIDEAQGLGAGKAPDGICGALYAALRLLENPEERETVRGAFAVRTGSEQCRAIRKARRVSCVQCVEIAAKLLYAVVAPR